MPLKKQHATFIIASNQLFIERLDGVGPDLAVQGFNQLREIWECGRVCGREAGALLESKWDKIFGWIQAYVLSLCWPLTWHHGGSPNQKIITPIFTRQPCAFSCPTDSQCRNELQSIVWAHLCFWSIFFKAQWSFHVYSNYCALYPAIITRSHKTLCKMRGETERSPWPSLWFSCRHFCSSFQWKEFRDRNKEKMWQRQMFLLANTHLQEKHCWTVISTVDPGRTTVQEALGAHAQNKQKARHIVTCARCQN